MPFLYDVCNVKLQLYAKGLVWSRGGKHFSKTFSIFYMLNSKNRVFYPYFFNCYLSNEKTAFVDNSRVKATIFFIEKISYSLKLFSGHFYGQSFIKTVRGPCKHKIPHSFDHCDCIVLRLHAKLLCTHGPNLAYCAIFLNKLVNL